MRKLDILTERFFKVASTPIVKEAKGGVKTRQRLMKEVQDAKDGHGKKSDLLAKKQQEYEQLGAEIGRLKKDVSDARTNLKRNYDILHNMDVSDCNAVKWMADDDVAYIKGGKLFRIEERDGEMHLVPYKKKYNKKEKPQEETKADNAKPDDTADVDDNEDVDDVNDIDDFIKSFM